MCKISTNLYISYLKRLLVIACIFVIQALHFNLIGKENYKSIGLTDTVNLHSSDSIKIDTSKFVQPDTITSDSLKFKKKKKKPAIDEPVKYTAKDSLFYDLDNKKVFLYGDAEVNYKNINLKAAYIEFNMADETVFAKGMPDSTGEIKGTPVFKEGNEQFDAHWLHYNFKTKKGFIYFVKTKQEDGTLIGDSTKRVSNGNVNIKGGTYSTCDLDHPHFYIGLTRAKEIPDDKIVSGPVYLVVADIPLPIIFPFGFFPNTKSAASGLLIPSPGEDQTRGFFIHNLGYYFAFNDYIDSRIYGDIYSKGSWILNTNINYRVRYRYMGSLNFSYASNVYSEKGLPDYQVANDYNIMWSHSQDSKANPNRTFSASVNMSSSSYDARNSYDLNSYFTNQKNSSISFSQSWPNFPFRFTGSFNHSQNSLTKKVEMTLPNISFTPTKTFYPFRRKELTGEPKWYENIQYSYTSQLQNKIQTYDTLMFTKDMFKNMQNGYQHSIPISTNVKLGKFLNFSPGLTYKGMLYTHYITYEDSTYLNKNTNQERDTFVVRNHNQLRYAHSYLPSFSLTATPKFYGMYLFKNSNIKAIRHVMSPTASFSFTPDVSHYIPKYSNQYIQENTSYPYLVDTNGMTTMLARHDVISNYYSFFDKEIYGSPTPSTPHYGTKSATISLSLRNTFEMKYLSGKDTAVKEKKLSLLENLDFNTNYYVFTPGDIWHWSDLQMNTGTTLFEKKLDVKFNATFDPYAIDSAGNRLKYFEWTTNHQLMRLTQAGITLGTRFTSSEGKKDKDKTGEQQTQTQFPKQTQDMIKDVHYDIPWSFNVNYQWNYTKQGIKSIIFQTINFSGDLSITKKWKVLYSSGYDFTINKFITSSFTISRDLHCWQMQFTCVPFGPRAYYNFTINVVKPILHDLKYTKNSDWQKF